MPSSDDHIVAVFLDAYRAGAFPMAEPPRRRRAGQPWPIHWYRPQTRAVFELTDDGLHVSRSLRTTLRRACFRITSDTAFEQVIRACARPTPDRGLPWLSEELIRCYVLLHSRGLAHSVEAWIDPPPTPSAVSPAEPAPAHPLLIGGIYGVHIGAAFFAESMFCRPDAGGTDASKVCLFHLFHHLRRRGFLLLDSQIANPHTLRLGVREIPLPVYLERLHTAAAATVHWEPFEREETLTAR